MIIFDLLKITLGVTANKFSDKHFPVQVNGQTIVHKSSNKLPEVKEIYSVSSLKQNSDSLFQCYLLCNQILTAHNFYALIRIITCPSVLLDHIWKFQVLKFIFV